MDYAVIDPATGKVVARYPFITDEELESALARSDAAFTTWARSAAVATRSALVAAVGRLHRERAPQLAAAIVREMGKPIDQAHGEIEFAADIYAYYAENAAAFLADEAIDCEDGTGTAVLRRAPVGVLLGIMPWNFPAYQVARFAGPNLCAGNTILLKHAPQCPESAQIIAGIIAEAAVEVGASPDVYLDLRASTDQAALVIADRRVRGVSVTGSERAGRAVAEIAGRHLTKVALELGGSDPFILLSTASMDGAVEDAVNARLDNSGQSCNAAKRFVVIDELYDDFEQRFTAAFGAVRPGDPLVEGTALGPLSSAAAADRLTEQIDRAIAQGARVLVRGARDGNFIGTTVLTDVTPAMDAHHEEFFGPVAVLYRVADEAAAVAVANDTPFGLGSYVYTTDPVQAERVADQIDAGMVWVNMVLGDAPQLPFGGTKQSGTGRELGRAGMQEFLNVKLIRTA